MKTHFKKSKRLNPIYSLLQSSSNPTYHHKTDKDHQKYFLKKLPTVVEKIEFIDQKLWDITDQHITIYKEHNDKYYYIAAYHFTMTLTYANEASTKVHCYFNSRGVYQEMTVKKEEKYQEVSLNLEAKLKDHAELCSLNTFAELQKSLESRCAVLRDHINKKEQSIKKLSHNIEKNLKDYIKIIDQLIPLLEEIDELGEYNRPKIEIYQRILNLYSKQKESETSMTQEIELSVSPTSSAVDDEKLEESEYPPIISSKEKNVDLTKKEFDELIQNLKKMNSTEFDKNSLIEEALHGDEKSMQQVLDRNFPLNIYSYFRMATLGNKKFFEKAYERSPINLNTLIIMDDNKDNNGLTFLAIAYAKRSFGLFEYLLQKGANPNVSFLNGERLIHHISENGELDYAKCLLKYCPVTDISSFSALGKKITVNFLSPDFKALKKTKQYVEQNCLDNNISNTSPVTPLMIAAYYRQEKMVKFLLESKANPILDYKKTTLMELASTGQFHSDEKEKTLKKINPNIILMLVKHGMSVDSLFYLSGVDMTGLYYACEEGDLGSVKILIENFGADINFTTSKPDTVPILGDNLKLSPLFIAIAGIKRPKNVNNAFEFEKIVNYLITQDFVPLKLSILKQVLAYKKFLSLPGKIETKIQSNKDKINFLKEANHAYNDHKYELSVNHADKGLKLCLNNSQYSEQFLKVTYLACFELGKYLNSGLFCAYYLKCLKLKLEKILDPGIHDKLKKDYDQGQKMLLKINKNLNGGHMLLFDEILKSKDDAEMKHLPLLH